MEENCCRLVPELIKNYQDEIDANIEYSKIARNMEANGITYAKTMKLIADDEFKHLVLLHGLVSILNESCGCKVEIPVNELSPERMAQIKESLKQYGLG